MNVMVLLTRLIETSLRKHKEWIEDSSQYQRAKDEADIERKGANRKAVGQGAGGAGGALAGAAAWCSRNRLMLFQSLEQQSED